MIRSVTFERSHVQRPALEVRGRHAEHLRRRRARRRDRLRRGPRHRGHRRARAAAARSSRPRSCCSIPGVEIIGTAAHKAAVHLVHDGRHASARHRHDPRYRRRRRAHRPPLRDAGDGFLRGAGHRARLVRLLQHRRRGRPAGRRAPARCARCSADGAEGPLPRRDPRSQPRRRAISASSSMPDARADGHNPLCGDRLTVSLQHERRPRRGRALRRQGLRDLHRLRLADDRSRQGQGPRDHRRAVRQGARAAHRAGAPSPRRSSASSPRSRACANFPRA